MALRKNSRKLTDMGVYENLAEDFPTIEQLEGNTKVLAEIIGVKSALSIVEKSLGKTDFYFDGYQELIALRDKRMERDYHKANIEPTDLTRKYGICITRVRQILGLFPKGIKLMC